MSAEKANGTTSMRVFTPAQWLARLKAGQRPQKDPECKAKSRQVGKEKGNIRKKQLRRCRNK